MLLLLQNLLWPYPPVSYPIVQLRNLKETTMTTTTTTTINNHRTNRYVKEIKNSNKVTVLECITIFYLKDVMRLLRSKGFTDHLLHATHGIGPHQRGWNAIHTNS